MQAISAIGIFSSIIYAILLFNKKGKSFPDKILIAWMFVFAIHLILPFMMSIGNRFFIEKVNGLDIGFYTLHITFMYYYSLGITNKIKGISGNHLIYLVPTAVVYIVQGVIDRHDHFFTELMSQYFFNNTKIFHLTGVVILNLTFCIYFSRKTFILLNYHRKSIKNSYSYSENIDLCWLRNLFVAALIFTIFLALYLLALLKGRLNEEWINNYYFTSFSVFVVILGYWGYKQGVIINENTSVKSQSELGSPESKIPEKTNISETHSNDSEFLGIKNYMEQNKPYLDSKLTIGILALKLNIPVHQLSKHINRHFNKNFYEFVNEYRIDEFKRLVADPKNKSFSILGLAYDAGFSSKATFNRIFRNYTGQTPSQFRENFKF